MADTLLNKVDLWPERPQRPPITYRGKGGAQFTVNLDCSAPCHLMDALNEAIDGCPRIHSGELTIDDADAIPGKPVKLTTQEEQLTSLKNVLLKLARGDSLSEPDRIIFRSSADTLERLIEWYSEQALHTSARFLNVQPTSDAEDCGQVHSPIDSPVERCSHTKNLPQHNRYRQIADNLQTQILPGLQALAAELGVDLSEGQDKAR